MDTLAFYGSAVGRGLLVAVPLVVAVRLAQRLRPDWFAKLDPEVVAAAQAAGGYDRVLAGPTFALGVGTGVGVYWLFRGLRSAWEARMPPHAFLVRDPAGQADVPFEIVGLFFGILAMGWWYLPLLRLGYGRAGSDGYLRLAAVQWRGEPVRHWGRVTLVSALLLVPPALLLVDNYLRVEAERVVVSDYLAWRARVYRFDEVRAVVWAELPAPARRRADDPTHELRIEFADGDRWRTSRPDGLMPMAEWMAARAGVPVRREPAGR